MKLLDFREDVNEKANRIGYADIEINWMGGFIIRDIAIHEKDKRRWISFRSKKTDQKNEKGYDIWIPLVQFKESHVHGDFSSLLWKEIDSYRATFPQKSFGDSRQGQDTKTQPNQNYGHSNQFQPNELPF